MIADSIFYENTGKRNTETPVGCKSASTLIAQNDYQRLKKIESDDVPSDINLI